VVNVHKEPVQVTDIWTAMGPLNIHVDNRLLQPGEKTSFTVEIDTRRFANWKEMSAFVTFGPTHVSTTALRVKAISRQDLECSRGSLDFGQVRPGQTASMQFDVRYSGDADFRVTELVVPKDAPYEATLARLERTPELKSCRVTATLKKNAPRGRFVEQFEVKTNDPGMPVFPYIVRGEVTDNIDAVPVFVPRPAPPLAVPAAPALPPARFVPGE
jgi:hypothetical protein